MASSHEAGISSLLFIFKASGEPQLKARPGFHQRGPIARGKKEESWWLRAFRRGLAFRLLRSPLFFLSPKALPEAGRCLCGQGQVSRRVPGSRTWQPSPGSSGGSVNPPGSGRQVARGQSPGLPAPANRGTATPTGRTGTYVGAVGAALGDGTGWLGLGGRRHPRPRLGPALRGLACPQGKAKPPLLENPKGWGRRMRLHPREGK